MTPKRYVVRGTFHKTNVIESVRRIVGLIIFNNVFVSTLVPNLSPTHDLLEYRRFTHSSLKLVTEDWVSGSLSGPFSSPLHSSSHCRVLDTRSRVRLRGPEGLRRKFPCVIRSVNPVTDVPSRVERTLSHLTPTLRNGYLTLQESLCPRQERRRERKRVEWFRSGVTPVPTRCSDSLRSNTIP